MTLVVTALPHDWSDKKKEVMGKYDTSSVQDGGAGCDKVEMENKGRVQEHHHNYAVFNEMRGSSRMDDFEYFNHADDYDNMDSGCRGASAGRMKISNGSCSITPSAKNIFDDDAYNEFLRSVGRKGEAGKETSPFHFSPVIAVSASNSSGSRHKSSVNGVASRQEVEDSILPTLQGGGGDGGKQFFFNDDRKDDTISRSRNNSHDRGRWDVYNAFLMAPKVASSDPSFTLTNNLQKGHTQKGKTLISKSMNSDGIFQVAPPDMGFLEAMRGKSSLPSLHLGVATEDQLHQLPPTSGGSVSSIESSSSPYWKSTNFSRHQQLPCSTAGAKNKSEMFTTCPNMINSENDVADNAGSAAIIEGERESKDDPIADANALLGALRAESVLSDEDEGGGGGGRRDGGRVESYFNRTPVMDHARVHLAKQHLPGQRTNKQHCYQAQFSVDTDSKFLMAVHGSQATRSGTQCQSEENSYIDDGGTGGDVSDTYDSGTLVMITPSTGNRGCKGFNVIESSSSSFMMAIHSSNDDDETEGMVASNGHSKIAGGEGEDTEDASLLGREARPDFDNDAEEEDEDDDILDEDITDLKIPTHSFMEKLYLPRPLFFGHILPPRIIIEVECAASEYRNRGADVSEEATNAASSSVAEQQQLQSVSIVNVDTESFAADDSSVLSSMSLSSLSGLLVGGGKLFEPSVAPCCRNLEGAIDVFGFGFNPFTQLAKTSSADIANHHNKIVAIHTLDGGDNCENFKGPHPYVCIYSPVWEEWSVAARAKARRRRGRILDGMKKEVLARKAAEGAAKSTMHASSIKSNQQDQQQQPPSSSSRRRHKKTTSVDFLDSLRGNLQSLSSLPPVNKSDAMSSSTFLPDGLNKVLQRDVSANELFLPCTHGGSNNGASAGFTLLENSSPKPMQVESLGFSQDQFLKYAREGVVAVSETSYQTSKEMQSSNDNMFQNQYLPSTVEVTTDKAVGTFVGKVSVDAKFHNASTPSVSSSRTPSAKKIIEFFVPPLAMDSSTFVQAVINSSEGESDNDFIEAAEERTAVGINDNISAAAAMLEGSGGVDDDDYADIDRGVGTPMFMAAGGGAKAANKYGRPYSNFELTNGCTPQFGCDDPSLPHESDLGVFETKEEEKRSTERRHEQNMIEEFASPGIMSHVACPTLCLDLDDSTSWNSRYVGGEMESNKNRGNTMLISLDGNSLDYTHKVSTTHQQKSPLYEVSRIAWWNLPDGHGTYKDRIKARQISRGGKGPAFAAAVFPAWDNPMPLDVQTNLWPSLTVLRKNNISGSRSHTATSISRFLPHLSDRPPSVRHLQIDTTAVGFPKLGGEIEPMFCKLAIYHFEMSAERSAGLHIPSPNMERCGRVTESLSFDIVQDSKVIQNCKNALWPYTDEANIHGLLTSTPYVLPEETQNRNAQSEGTSCGIFPLPAFMSISNLYAVIIVHRVVSESPDKVHPYYKPDRRELSQESIDLAKLRFNATKNCTQYGQFITPFAFGVVPLKHIIGDESPKIPASRAVQIPLFKFDPERGGQSIFDHILLMLHPRAEPKGSKVASMTRGHALLVMRYFGYLGLHSILKRKSSLAREHLVDFTGELTVKCKNDMAADGSRYIKKKCPTLGEAYILPPWQNQYTVEPAVFGGRNVTEPRVEEGQVHENCAPKYLYAQEIATLPLERSVPESSSSGRSKSSNRCKYDGKLLHTSLCNELICQPKMLKNCNKKNIVIKVELRELLWNDALDTDIGIPVTPSIHNTRRGPWLVQEAFSSCAMGTPQFLDEFKIKLPLILGASGCKKYGLLFSVYHLIAPSKKRSSARQNDSSGGTESGYSIERLGCGFLPLTLENVPTCLIANGNYDVPIKFRAIQSTNKRDKMIAPPSVLRHQKPSCFADTVVHRTRSWSSCSEETGCDRDELTNIIYVEENYPEGSIALIPLEKADDDTQEDDKDTDENSLGSSAGESSRTSHIRSESSRKNSFDSNMILQVTVIAFSSVHPQCKALADLFLTKPNPPRCLMPSDFSEPYSAWGKTQSEIQYRLKPERIPPFNFVGGALAETERKLLDPVISLTKSSKCPHSDLTTHLVRIVAQLWRTAVSGVGEPSILWASPESLIPLRLNAFATLLHTVSSASHHMAKAGLRQLDGITMWDMSALGKILSMLFDEWAIFGGPLENPISVAITSKKRSLSKPEIISNRARTTTGISPQLSRPSIVERYSSESLDISRVKRFDVDAMLKPNIPKPNIPKQDNHIVSNETNPLTSVSGGFKVDSKNDFMLALNASLDTEPYLAKDAPEQKSTTRGAENLFKSVVHGPAANRRRWNTLPLHSLATIQENYSDRDPPGQQVSSSNKERELIETELVFHPEEKTKKSRQFRVPHVKLNDDLESMSSFFDRIVPPTKEKQGKDDVKPPQIVDTSRTLPTDDVDIETAGTAFLDAISKSMGFGDGHTGKEFGGEERRVGAAHHRKTRSRCSIDWSLPPADMLLEKDQRIEELNRSRLGSMTPTIMPLSPIGSLPDDASSDDDTANIDSSIDGTTHSSTFAIKEEGTGREHPLKRHRRSLSKEGTNLAAIILPDFADRMSAMKNGGDEKPCEKRWWPYVYEVIIYQWVALLDEQTKKGEGGGKKSEEGKNEDTNTSGLSPIVIKYLSQAAKAARGATIRCAPFLLGIIIQSLSWRIDCVFRRRMEREPSLEETNCEDVVPPLVKLDDNIMSALEKLITMLIDASIDSRNFDSFEYRKISVDVNDAVVRFIRDLFSILDVQLVHRLVLVYFSRFVVKEGKHWHDRDSKVTGLRCSWETTKLRLNAVTLFVRFPGFLTVCPPFMESWTLPVGSSADVARRFYSDALEKINSLGLSEFTASDGPVRKEPLIIPKMKPHWLAELCTDICLSATGHAEENIQFRASSLLFEIFWRHSQQGRVKGNVSVVASIYVPFLAKVLSHIEYLSSLPPKGQIRKDILPCTLLVLQSAPTGIMRALWRKLAKRAEGKTLKIDSADKYGGIMGSGSGVNCSDTFSSLVPSSRVNEEIDADEEPDIFDMFGLLNLSLSTIEYEGIGHQIEENLGAEATCHEKSIWRREYLLSSRVKSALNPRNRPFNFNPFCIGEISSTEQPTTNRSRRWHAHDCSIVIINICRQVVREILLMLKPNLTSENDAREWEFSLAGMSGSRSLSDIILQPTLSSIEDSDIGNYSEKRHEEGKAARMRKRLRKRHLETLTFAITDSIIFVRAAASVYLHALSMKQSDVVISRTLTAAIEIVKIFGIKLFLAAVGETLQHWMRVILEHCGARRAELRVDACEFLNLLLRLTYDSFGSFTRVRLPLLAVQSEVMERIVAKASRKYLMEQRCLDLSPISLSNDSAEASLTPLWRTIDRLHNQSASQNLSFKSALSRLAIKMKKIYRAYLAAHALAIVNRSESGSHVGDVFSSQSNPYVQKIRVSVHRIVSNSSWFSKRFLGNQTSGSLDRSMIQIEAVEDSFLIAADVFSSSELPSHRVAWLQKLAEFHRMRGRFAEEATCRCKIYHTYREAAKLHDHIWSSSPFLPWASTHPDGEVHAIVSDYDYEMENLSGSSGKLIERGTAFRRIFYRAADSVHVRTGDWGAVSGGKYLFYGVTLKSEFDSVSPWYSHREMEENMVEEAELSGDLFLRAGIVESSRYAWSLANQFYSETFNYARLAYVYRRLALVVTSQVPIIDVSNQLDLSSALGRFYKVYFHGGAPDDLLHSQGSGGFIYRVPSSVQIKDFAKRLEDTIRCILPAKTVIDLLLDDGSPTMTQLSNVSKRSSVIGGAPIEPVKIKVTPLRPLFKIEDDEKCFRGTPEWFQLKVEDQEHDVGVDGSTRNLGRGTCSSLHHRVSTLSSCTSNSLSSVGSVTVSHRRSTFRLLHRKSSSSHQNHSHELDRGCLNGEPIGVDRFYFTQPMRKDHLRGFRDWLKVPRGFIAERSLRVTELQVENSFPACITRQQIIHRAVFTQSPLEASVEAVSTWCSVLFRTVIATNGQGVLAQLNAHIFCEGGQQQQGLSAESAKLVMECIHSSGVKQLGTTFLSVNTREELVVSSDESNVGTGMYSPYESLSEEEVEKVQTKLARMIVTFLELLHLLIARNRDVLLTVVQARKRRGGDAFSVASCSVHGYIMRPRTGSQSFSPVKRDHAELSTIDNEQALMYDRSNSDIVVRSTLGETPEINDGYGQSNISDRTDSAIGVQSELQRGLISLVRSLTPPLLDTLNNEVPKWMRSGCQENYFSTGQYRQADIPIGDELFFNVDTSGDDDRASKSESSYAVPRSIRGSGNGSGNESGHTYRENSPTGSLCSGASDRRDHFDRTMSAASQRPPTDDRDRSNHRMGISGAS
ncbi:hypothetical protein ACHAXA_001128 [Cyclostephanos tholiformis]|uniref:C2 DOCK-type domain-containing protein n=1 Tax=Cyclostephanos tholiformis TaxID=382380 RepID=A0ABD3R843_9STRA